MMGRRRAFVWTATRRADRLGWPENGEEERRMCARHAGLALGLLALSLSCTPTVKVEAPKEPIVINMNVKIEHEIRVRVDKDLDSAFEDETLF
jgi:hypothetical protein